LKYKWFLSSFIRARSLSRSTNEYIYYLLAIIILILNQRYSPFYTPCSSRFVHFIGSITKADSKKQRQINYLRILRVSPKSLRVMLYCFWVFLLLEELITCTS
jgi:hypothetical protein